MEESDHTLGLISSFEAVSQGAPGNRTFHLKAISQRGTATIRVEKEQLNSLIMAFERIFRLIDDQADHHSSNKQSYSDSEVAYKNNNLDLDFKSGNMSLKYDEISSAIELIVFGEVQEDNQSPLLTLLLSQKIAEDFVEAGLEVYGAGRSKCPLCDTLLNPNENHICPRSNGHATALN
jgi:uncharacterized repeat protein (TIGR03847 family)